MGYLHIDNLYKTQTILLFKKCYALEKIHGTSAHVRWQDGKVALHSGGESAERFAALFDQVALAEAFAGLGQDAVIVYGEAYGGKQQGMSKTYGKNLKFVAFDVKIGDSWLNVPKAVVVVDALGLEFVHWQAVGTDLESLDAERDALSVQSERNGVDGEHVREGVVLRTLEEMSDNRGNRVIAKHKRAEFRERKSIPEVDPAKQELLTKASDIADEWVTPMRLRHVLDKLPEATEMKHIPIVVTAMVADVIREADEFVVDNKVVRKAIGRKAVELYKAHVTTIPKETP